MKKYLIGFVIAIPLCVVVIFAQPGVPQAPTAEQTLTLAKDTKIESICWVETSSTTCVPLSVIRTEFEGFKVGSLPPVAVERQRYLEALNQLATVTRIKTLLEGQIEPTAENRANIQQGIDGLLKLLQTACGTGWKPGDPCASKVVK